MCYFFIIFKTNQNNAKIVVLYWQFPTLISQFARLNRSSAFFLVPKSTIRFLRDIKNIAMLNASVALYTSFRFFFCLSSSLRSQNCAWLGIIQIQRSFNLQLLNVNVWTDFFHVIQRILQQAAPDQGISSWSRTWWGSYCGQPNDLALTEDRTSSKFCFQFFQVFFLCFVFSFTLSFYFCCKHYVTVRNTNYYLCFSQFEIECVFVCFCVSVQLIEEKYCCDCLFHVLWVCKARLWDLTRKDGKCEKILLQFSFCLNVSLKILIQNLVSSTFGTSHNLALNGEEKTWCITIWTINTKTGGK